MKLYVGNINHQTNEEALRELFSNAGDIVSVKLIKDRDSGRSRGFGFIEFETNKMGQTAISKFNGYEIDGFSLKVNEAKERGADNRRLGW